MEVVFRNIIPLTDDFSTVVAQMEDSRLHAEPPEVASKGDGSVGLSTRRQSYSSNENPPGVKQASGLGAIELSRR